MIMYTTTYQSEIRYEMDRAIFKFYYLKNVVLPDPYKHIFHILDQIILIVS